MNYLNHNGSFGRRESPEKWTEEMDKVVTTLIAESFSGAQVAQKINREFGTSFSRCAVIGRASRQKLGSFKHKSGVNAGPPRKRVRTYVPKPKPEPIPEIVSREIDDQQIPLEQRCTLMGLTQTTCRYPVGDPVERKTEFFFCGGETVPNQPYCAGHCLRAFNYEAKNQRLKKVWSRGGKPSASPDSVNYPPQRVG